MVIAHSIIAATQPAPFISSIQLGVGAFRYKKYGSDNFISVWLFKDSSATRNILQRTSPQILFDSADFKNNTI